MKTKALQLDSEARDGGSASPHGESTSQPDEETAPIDVDPNLGPKGNKMVAALQVLKPASLSLVDNSHQHAGHAGNDIDGESHFDLRVVAEAFDGLSLVQRHQLIYMLLGDIMPQIHALQISVAKTPAEAGERAASE